MSTEQQVTAPFPSSFERDLENARVLIEESPWKENPQKYRKVAEAIVRRVLGFDPSNEPAKLLLEKIEKTPEAPLRVVEPVAVVAPAPVAAPEPPPPPPPSPPKPQPVPAPVKIVEMTIPEPAPPPRRPVVQPDFSFVVDPPKPLTLPEISRRPPWAVIAVAAVGAIAGVTLLVSHRSTFTSEYTPKTPAPTVVQAKTAAPAPEPVSVSVPAAAPEQPVPIPPAPEPAPKAEAAPPAPAVVVKSTVAPVAPIQTGTLAVSSPTTVDIYVGGQLVGSAPTTLVLPAGNQVVEYRHQEQSKVVTHVIKANETTTAMITFEAVVQINARPWAQVFVDGPQRRPLGQTPLSDVLVPIGSVLVFENPNFPGKTYRVTGRETQIRVSFP